ncbi:MAG: hypothetical protein JWM91_730 [Rhodospirillales bacterium]|nr:hypothetical protein [Rhodospirillales bacterium]
MCVDLIVAEITLSILTDTNISPERAEACVAKIADFALRGIPFADRPNVRTGNFTVVEQCRRCRKADPLLHVGGRSDVVVSVYFGTATPHPNCVW